MHIHIKQRSDGVSFWIISHLTTLKKNSVINAIENRSKLGKRMWYDRRKIKTNSKCNRIESNWIFYWIFVFHVDDIECTKSAISIFINIRIKSICTRIVCYSRQTVYSISYVNIMGNGSFPQWSPWAFICYANFGTLWSQTRVVSNVLRNWVPQCRFAFTIQYLFNERHFIFTCSLEVFLLIFYSHVHWNR